VSAATVATVIKRFCLAKWLIAFRRHYPDIVLDVMFKNRFDDLLRNKVDIAVRAMPDPPQILVARHMGSVRYVAGASSDYAAQHGMPTRHEDLPTAPAITATVAGRQTRVAGYLDDKRHEILLEPSGSSENFVFLRDAILAGLGVGIVPDYVVTDDMRCGDIVTAFD
jgi:DNA-binding transcriptional LysR family regulator